MNASFDYHIAIGNFGSDMTVAYIFLKWIHMITAAATICGFILRGYWMMTDSPKLKLRVTRIAPHIIDTFFLLSGFALIALLQMNAFTQPWLLAKFAGLIGYIILGTIAIKRGPTLQARIIAFVAAIALFAYIIGVALSKSPASWLKFLAA